MRRRALIAAVAVLATYGAAQAAVSTAAAREALRARIRAALAPRLGDVDPGDARVDALFRVSFGPLAIPLRPGGAPVARIERVRVRPALLALLRGRVEPGRVDLRHVTLPAALGMGALDADLFPVRSADGDRVGGDVHLSGGGRVLLEVARGERGVTARVRCAAVGPGDLPAALRGPSAGIAGGVVSLDVDVDAAPDLSRARAVFRAQARDVLLAGARVGPAPAGPLGGEVRGTATWDGATRRIAVHDATVVVPGGIPVALAGALRLEDELPFSVAVRADRVRYAALVAALPPSLAPPASAPRPDGTFDARLDLSGPLAAPAAWTVDAALDLSALRATARKGPPSPLAATFVHHPDPSDPRRTLVVGPENPDFVPVAELPEHVVRAVTTSEDAGFFGHAGFDFDELRNALAEGTEAGHVVRGGSTITQQLAKNLFLSPDRTLARKVREAVIAVGLEASLPKRRLLEIYLNVAEWGPELWGIGPAARHWFGKDARDLTAKEAAFLASIIPSPVRYHAMYGRGFPSEKWEAHVNDILFKMTEQGALSDDQLVEGLHAPLYFTGG